ncbi:MAG: Mur ligase domain-containing protein, partial [Gammaproteobacteria bacterium]
MNLLILGICGTFMGGLALVARALGHEVRGCDAGVYPPMSTLLEREGIEVLGGYRETYLRPAPDLVLVGNALSRGNPCVESVLDRGIPYTSGPQWLAETVLRDRHVLAVSGTHGKTTTASLLAFLLEAAGQAPGFLIGGVPRDFGVSARLGSGT